MATKINLNLTEAQLRCIKFILEADQTSDLISESDGDGELDDEGFDYDDYIELMNFIHQKVEDLKE
jgi:hypothetical protein